VGKRKPSPIRIEGDVAFVGLSCDQEAMIDVADIPLVEGRCWHAVWHDRVKGYYAMRTRLKSEPPGPSTIYMHRQIMGHPEGLQVDHLHHNTLDNRRSELAIRTNQENNQNRRGVDSRSKTGVRGVSIHTLPLGQKIYAAKVSVVQYFPYTEEGLAQATARVAELRSRLNGEG